MLSCWSQITINSALHDRVEETTSLAESKFTRKTPPLASTSDRREAVCLKLICPTLYRHAENHHQLHGFDESCVQNEVEDDRLVAEAEAL